MKLSGRKSWCKACGVVPVELVEREPGFDAWTHIVCGTRTNGIEAHNAWKQRV